jgi:hypothetical protein
VHQEIKHSRVRLSAFLVCRLGDGEAVGMARFGDSLSGSAMRGEGAAEIFK